MCQQHTHHATRRGFLKAGGIALGSAAAAMACGKVDQLVELTATLPPSSATRPVPTLAPGIFSDAILVNGNLRTMDPARSVAKALAIKDGIILQVGSDDDIRALEGDDTQVIDLRGKTVLPGFIDAHNHLQVKGTLLNFFISLMPPEVQSLDDLLAKLADAVQAAPAGEWVQGYFWMVDPLPTREYLDPISPDNPLWVMQLGGHFGATNSLGLEIAGIDADTPDPEGGVIERDENGEPTGMFYNHRAMDLLRVHAPQPSEEDMLDNIRYAEQLMIEAGVTTFHDCNARFRAINAYMQAGEQSAMTMRGQVFYTLEWPDDLERALNEISHFDDDYMRFAGYKFLIDGQVPTWYTHEPHPGIRWNMPTWDPDQFKETIRQLHDTNLQVAVHCGGDAAVDLALDAFEEAMNANPRSDPRHRLEHAMLCTDEAVQRAADLGVQISSQPQFLRLFPAAVEEYLGADRAARLVRTRDWLDAGINVALGSDTPTSPWHIPQVTLLGAVLRPDPNWDSFHPEQVMTIDEALYAHTMGSAHAAFEENDKGSLEPGKFADLTVWSDDFTTVQPMDIVEVEPEMTMIGGEIVYEA